MSVYKIAENKNNNMRHFICCSDPFPYGSANSNYLRNMALALKNAGKNVFVIGLVESEDVIKGEKKGEFKGVGYINIIQRKSKLPFRLKNHLFFGQKIVQCLKQFELREEDYLIVYTDYISVTRQLFKAFPLNNKSGHMAYCIVEWFQAYQYTGRKFSLDYIFWKRHFDYLMPQYKKIIGISTKLAKHFSDMGCQTMVLPCLVDCKSVKESIITNRAEKTTFDFIYPGAATNKDSLEGLLKGLLELSKDERKKIKFHFTTLKPEKLLSASDCSPEILDELKDVITFHGRLEYDKLLELYENMDYLFLPRKKNIITESNFPSKVPEMLAYGTVPVCSDVGDYTSIYLKDGVNAFVFSGAEPTDCAEAFRRACSISQEEMVRMKNAARLLAEERFDYHVWSKCLNDFLDG